MVIRAVNNAEIGERAKALMHKNHDSTQELAYELGISDSNLRKMFRGEVNWPDDRIEYLADKYGISFEYLKYGEYYFNLNRFKSFDEIVDDIRKIIHEEPEDRVRKKMAVKLLEICTDELSRD